MLRPVFRVSTFLVLGTLLASCGWMPWAGARRRAAAGKALAESRRSALVVGQVSLVNEEERFALIEANLVQPPVAGTMLRIYTGSMVSAELRATGVRRRPFLVADLVKGIPAKGDTVVQPAAEEAAPPRAAAVTPAATPAPPRWKRWLGFLAGRK